MAYKLKNPRRKKEKKINQDNFELQKGEILNYSGSWGSGLGTFTIKRDDGKIVQVHSDNAPTIRSLESAYGDVIQEEHTFNVNAIKGKKIYYSVESWGTMAGFQPEEEASEELEEKYLKQFHK
jgi:hypothetical protein